MRLIFDLLNLALLSTILFAVMVFGDKILSAQYAVRPAAISAKSFTTNANNVSMAIDEISVVMDQLESRYKEGYLYSSYAMSHLAEARQYLAKELDK